MFGILAPRNPQSAAGCIGGAGLGVLLLQLAVACAVAPAVQAADAVAAPAVDGSGSSNSESAASATGDDRARLLFVSDFETGSIQGGASDIDGWAIQSGGLAGSNVVTDEQARGGKYSCRFTLRKSDWTGPDAPRIKPRAQLQKPTHSLRLEQDTEYWMGVSMFIPSSGWDVETFADNQTVFWQFHGTGGATGKSPPLLLQLVGDRLQILNRSGDAKGPSWQTEVLWSQETLEKDRWIDWVVRVNFSRDSTGYVEVWKDGIRVVNKQNAPTLYYTNSPRESDGVAVLLSLYKSRLVKRPSSVESLTMYYDEFRLAEGEDGYDLVDPAR